MSTVQDARVSEEDCYLRVVTSRLAIDRSNGELVVFHLTVPGFDDVSPAEIIGRVEEILSHLISCL